MTPFCKYWITATCAPESIFIIRENDQAALLGIRNETGNLYVTVVEHKPTKTIIGIGTTYPETTVTQSLSFKEACTVISDKLGLLQIDIHSHSKT